MLVYQFTLCLFGFIYSHVTRRERRELEAADIDLPCISLLIPAHNESLVLERTLSAMMSLEYPPDRLEVILINDASTDNTGEIGARWAAMHSHLRVVSVPARDRTGGKSAALNYGLKLARFQNIAVYDADNRPEPRALLHLGAQLAANQKGGAVIGTVPKH